MKTAKIILRYLMWNLNNSFIHFDILLDSRHTNASARRNKSSL